MIRPSARPGWSRVALTAICGLALLVPAAARAADPPAREAKPTERGRSEAPADPDREAKAKNMAAAEARAKEVLSALGDKTAPVPETPTYWELYQKGGVLMYPITFLSLVVVCFAIERCIGLRRHKVIPTKLETLLRAEIDRPGGISPRVANRLCQENPSSLALVIQEVLLRAGSSTGELERTLTAALERESSRLYFHVRWLNLSMSVAPMLGLLGTVQGMIIVFMEASQLGPGANKTQAMAEGIYLKLICTFAGLIVAVPAAVLSYLFEARIQFLMSQVDDLARQLIRKLQAVPHAAGDLADQTAAAAS